MSFMTVPAPGPFARGTGIVLRDALPRDESREVVQTAQDVGYDAVFVPEIDGREAFSVLTAFGHAADRILLGTGVVSMWSRTPVATAMAAATVQDLSGGRMILGVGAGSPTGLGGSTGAEARPLHLIEEFVRVVREAASGAPVLEGAAGDPFHAAGFVSSLGTDPFPIWLAALGDRMAALAGRIGDGVLLNWCPPERVASARAVVHDAASRAGRGPSDVPIGVYVRACLGVEEQHAMHALQEMTGLYASIPHYRRQLELAGLGEQAAIAANAYGAGRIRHVPEDLVRALILTGGRDAALRRFDAYRESGADVILVYPVAALDPFSAVLGTVLAAAPNPAVER
jgi:alkanesulfonate monooxygenase SsuD/methylene tetrahydromethanopterin reductase-like flavin-dependent oxidoreductase (luciferase family)